MGRKPWLPRAGSLHSRLLLSYLAVTLLVLGTVDFLSLTYLERSALEQHRLTLLDHARVVAGVSRQYMQKGHEYLEYIAQDYGRQVAARVLILDPQGTVLQDSFYEQAMLGSDLSARAEVTGALAGRPTTRLTQVAQVGRTLYAAAPIAEDGKPLGAVLVAQAVEPVYAGLAPVRRVLLLVSAAALVLACLAGWLLARSLARPVSLVTAGVRAVAGGDLAQRVPVQGGDELARLAEAFNAMADRLARVEASRRAFVADAAHELRTPLAALKALVEPLLSGAVAPGPEQAEFLGEIGREVDRLAELAADLLTLSDLEAGRPLQRSDVDLAELLGAVRARLLPLAREKGIALTAAAPPGLQAEADGLRLQRALYNLVHNAVSYSPAGTVVRITAGAVAGGVEIVVADRGPGIPAADLPRIFERFYRRERSRSRERGGAGLGLAIAREIVQAHGGQIQVETQVGEGSRFVVQIPVA